MGWRRATAKSRPSTERARRANVRAVSPPLFVLAFALAAGPRSIDSTVPTSVPAPAGVDVVEPVTPAPDDDEETTEAPRRVPPTTSTTGPRLSPVTQKPTAPRKPGEADKGQPRRRGGVLMAAIGAAGCTQDQCEDLKAMPWFALTGGYRFGRFAPILTIGGGSVPVDSERLLASDEIVVAVPTKETHGFLHIGAGTLLHLLASTRFDPYFGLTLGFLQTSVRSRQNNVFFVDGSTFTVEFDDTERVSRGALGIVLGLGFRIRERWTLGPRVDVLVPFSGKTCVQPKGGDAVCTDLDDIETVDPGQHFPRPWSAMLQVGVFL